MNGAILTKWDASIVGEKPPIGAFVSEDGATLIPRTKAPWRLEQAFRLLFKNQRWTLHFDASRVPGCVEIVKLDEGKSPELIYQRKD